MASKIKWTLIFNQIFRISIFHWSDDKSEVWLLFRLDINAFLISHAYCRFGSRDWQEDSLYPYLSLILSELAHNPFQITCNVGHMVIPWSRLDIHHYCLTLQTVTSIKYAYANWNPLGRKFNARHTHQIGHHIQYPDREWLFPQKIYRNRWNPNRNH